MELTSKQRAQLRGIANSIDTILIVGKDGIGENLGWIRLPQNADLADRLRCAFAEWYDNGHTNEADENTVILRVRLMDGILFHHGTRYEIDFGQ